MASEEVQMEVDSARWAQLQTLLSRATPFGNETGKLPNGEFEPSPEALARIQEAKILVVGAGGLGCEILKDLALLGFVDIHVIDLDTIDVSNLNRQFLFRQKDVGKPKAVVAAAFINERIPGCKVTAYHGKIQDYDEDFYRQFNLIISGLDNIQARRWLNSLLVNMVDLDEDGEVDPSTVIPLIDGGTEGFKGQARVILPRITSCFECSLDSFPPQRVYPMCTIAETPRLPEHCISYAYVMEWPQAFPDRKLDKDSPEDMQWVYERALARAEKYNIQGVTYMLTMGVVKNIIPAVASTNAVIAAACVNEAFKLLTFASQSLNTYYMYMGSTGVYTHTFEYGRRADCLVCSGDKLKVMEIQRDYTLMNLIDALVEDPELQLKQPSIATATTTLYMQKPPALEQATRPNLAKTLSELVQPGEVLTVTDPLFPPGVALSISLKFV